MHRLLHDRFLWIAASLTVAAFVLALAAKPSLLFGSARYALLLNLMVALNVAFIFGAVCYVIYRLFVAQPIASAQTLAADNPEVDHSKALNVLAQECLRATRYRHPLSLMIIAPISSARSEAELELLRATISRRIRSTDWLARIDGHQFLVLLPETPPHEASILAGHIRNGCQRVLRTPIHENSDLHRVKVGVCGFVDADISASELFDSCREALRDASHESSQSIELKVLNESALYGGISGELELR